MQDPSSDPERAQVTQQGHGQHSVSVPWSTALGLFSLGRARQADPPSNSVCLQPWHCRKRLWYFRFLPVRNVRLSAPATKTDHRGGAGTQSPELFLAQTLSCQNCLGGGTTHPGAPAEQGGQGRKIWARSKAERIAAAETRPPAL